MTSLLVAGGRRADGRPIDVLVRDGRIASLESTPDLGASLLDATGMTVSPGFLDLQVNGLAGIDLTDEPEGLWAVAAALPRYGVTGFLPTMISAPGDRYERALAIMAGGPPPGWRGARPLGWHFEGPMLSPRRAGAHPSDRLRALSPALLTGWSRDEGVTMATLAPELPGALEAVAALTARGVVVAAGHTEATVAEMGAAVTAGVRYATHLFNAMPPIHHRAPGPAGAVLAGLPVVAGLIADGQHVDPSVVALTWRALGPARCNLVSDASAALGAGSSTVRLAGREVTTGPPGPRLADGTLAGGDTGLDVCVANLVRFAGCSAAQALETVTRTPSTLLGRRDLGAIEVGRAGDLTLLDARLGVVATVVGGEVLHARAAGRSASRA